MLPFLVPFLGPVIDKLVGLIPDKAAAEKAKTEAMLAMSQQNDDMVKALLASDQAQDAINEKAAASGDAFSERARPAALWMCIISLGYQGMVVPLVQDIFVWTGHIAPLLPVFSADLTHDLLYGLLGLGGLHAYQAVKSN